MSGTEWAGAQVIAAARDGHVESLATLIAQAHPHVLRFARTLCASPQDAEDAAQEALLILFRKVGMLRSVTALSSWMFRIVRNECLRRLRPHPQDDLHDAGTVESPEDAVILRLEADRVARAIAALPEVQRRVLILRDVQGYPGSAVADSLGLSLAAMKSQLHRARANLKAALQP
ncbi:RNA polymerase sigma factor [Virgisporangium aliadipatigenens]|uniref:RNA polymerase sigma factor n=1 Tax=Virgisporangium aliadipatigenens TaxID=741659 RepID=A0A8J4DRA6_9ACTN|nr:sigma-70 family RNA polymerase sigma factor [Virgisporangium aliadipatigenens]GIJ46137.1 RNA polymerase sigma factor [Virgisporangium aliadipatigenens]